MSETQERFEIAFLGHYTKDTIVVIDKEKTVDGGAVIYGANVTARMGLKTAIITRMARQDFRVLEQFGGFDVHTFRQETSNSTALKLVYASSNFDERVVYLVSFAQPFTVKEVCDVKARTFHVASSLRDEVPYEIVKSLRGVADKVSLDVQGFVRVNRNGKLVSDRWEDASEVLRHVDVVKADHVEARILTGKDDRRDAAESLSALGPNEVVITRNDGVLVRADGKYYEAPFIPKELNGRSGRGDTCIAAYLAKRLTSTPAEATVWAAAVTSLKLENEGPFRRTISDVSELIKQKYQH